ncbi:unnamed protein product, partial [Acidithrix sp. C25]
VQETNISKQTPHGNRMARTAIAMKSKIPYRRAPKSPKPRLRKILQPWSWVKSPVTNQQDKGASDNIVETSQLYKIYCYWDTIDKKNGASKSQPISQITAPKLASLKAQRTP